MMATTFGDIFGNGGKPDTGSVPPVDPADLQSVWKMQSGFQALRPGEQMAISIDSYKLACGPGADVHAVFERVSLLRILQKQGVLSPWLRGGILDEAVFQVAATIFMSRMQLGIVYHKLPFDKQEFLKQIEKQAKNLI